MPMPGRAFNFSWHLNSSSRKIPWSSKRNIVSVIGNQKQIIINIYLSHIPNSCPRKLAASTKFKKLSKPEYTSTNSILSFANSSTPHVFLFLTFWQIMPTSDPELVLNDSYTSRHWSPVSPVLYGSILPQLVFSFRIAPMSTPLHATW